MNKDEDTPLVEQVLKNKKKLEDQNVAPLDDPNKNDMPMYDELGIKTSNSTDYIVIRILELNFRNKQGLLHSRKHQTELWIGDEQQYFGTQTIYRLSRYNKVITRWQAEIIWQRLLQVVPRLDESKIAVTEHLYWDKVKGEMCHSDKPLLGITTGF